MRGALFLLLMLCGLPVEAAELPGEGLLEDSSCIACHADTAAAWRDGPHGSAQNAGCVACHGSRHATSGTKARRSETCVQCHGGQRGATSRSYRTSKHGVIATLEQAGWNWSARLTEANYRAPSCAYCHMHDGAHGRLLSPDVLEASCLDCHSPRYVQTINDAGSRMLEIANLKVTEAYAAAEANGSPEIAGMLKTMQKKTLRNLRLGVGHQSPDYQWWYGHAALDGDLLRIKSALSRQARERK